MFEFDSLHCCVLLIELWMDYHLTWDMCLSALPVNVSSVITLIIIMKEDEAEIKRLQLVETTGQWTSYLFIVRFLMYKVCRLQRRRAIYVRKLTAGWRKRYRGGERRIWLGLRTIESRGWDDDFPPSSIALLVWTAPLPQLGVNGIRIFIPPVFSFI